MVMQGEKIKNGGVIYKCFLFHLFLGIVAFLPFLFKEQGMLSLGTDYDNIVMPLWESARKAIWNGEIFWSWNFDLGTDFVGANSFMALGSPFFWISLLLPNVDYLYLGAGLFILKYAVAGLSSAAYLSRFTDNKRCIIIGSVLYSFSGFQSVNLMFGCFHDVVSLFPLLLYGLEVLVKDKKRGVFALYVFLNALVNYYFFIGEVIFLIIYYFVRFFPKNKEQIYTIFHCLWEGLLGVVMACVLFYPSILFILQNPRSQEAFSISKYLGISSISILKLARTLLFPGEMMQQWSCVIESDWTSSSTYLPMVGLVLVLCFFYKKGQDWNWLKKMIFICLLLMSVPMLNSIFTLMTDSYNRWFYMPILMFCLSSIKVLEDHKKILITWSAIAVLGAMCLFFLGFFLLDKYKIKLIFIKNEYWFMNGIALTGILLLLLINVLCKNRERFITIILVCVSLFAVFTTIYTIKRYQDVRGYEVETYVEKQEMMKELGKNVDMTTSPYRLASIDNVTIGASDIWGSGSSYSNVQKSIFTLWSKLGEKRRVVSPEITSEYYDLVGAKYYIKTEECNDDSYGLLDQQKSTNTTYSLYEKNNVNAIGVIYSDYMLESEFVKLNKDQKIDIMQQAIIISSSMESSVSEFLQKYTEGSKLATQKDIENYVRGKNGFTFTTDVSKECAILIKVPYSEYWNCYVNNVKTDIYETNGFMMLLLKPGEYDIKFSYFNCDVLMGILLSLCGWCTWIVYQRRIKH